MAKVVPLIKSDGVGPIETDVPVPTRATYPFAEMKVGNSFTVSGIDRVKAVTASLSYGKRHNMRFISRKEGDRIRIWRIK